MHKTCWIMAIFDNDLLVLHCAMSPLNFKPMRSLKNQKGNVVLHDDVIKWKHFPRSLQWRQNGHYGVSNHQPHDCLLNRLFGPRSMETSKLRVTGLCAGNSPVTGEFPAQMANNAENVSIWWRHHVTGNLCGEFTGHQWIPRTKVE